MDIKNKMRNAGKIKKILDIKKSYKIEKTKARRFSTGQNFRDRENFTPFQICYKIKE